MFDNYNGITAFNYQINLDSVVRAVCEISIDIGKQLVEKSSFKDSQQEFAIRDLFDESFLTEISVRVEDFLDREEDGVKIKGIGKEDVIAKAATYFNDAITKSENFLSNLSLTNEILILDRAETKGLTTGKPRERMRNALKSSKFLKELISKIKDQKIRNSLVNLEIFENDNFYKDVVTIEELVGMAMLKIIEIDKLSSSKIRYEDIDEGNIWINEKFYKNLFSDFSTTSPVVFAFDVSAGKKIGVAINKYFIPFPNIDLTNYIVEDYYKEYFYKVISETFSKKRLVPSQKKFNIIDRFQKDSLDPKFNELLSNLKNNFYLDAGLAIDSKFSDYFHTVVSLEKLEKFEDYQFLLANNEGDETAIGIYSRLKVTTEYNLLHWMNHKGDRTDHYRKVEAVSKKKILVSALKPPISFYFLSKYFEDSVENILKSIGINFISNHSLSNNGTEITEIDFLINGVNKIVYAEAKTKLSKYNIEAYLKTASHLIDKFKPLFEHGVEIDFLLISCFSDVNVTDFQYFIDSSSSESDYNKVRENLNCLPYKFTVPIPDKKGMSITCISEPNFEKLEQLLRSICQK